MAWLAPLHGKCLEASQLYTVPLSQRANDPSKDDIEDLLNISFVEMRTPSLEAQYQIGLELGVPQLPFFRASPRDKARAGGGGGGGLGGLGGGGFGGRDIDYLFSLSCKVFTASSRS